MEADLGRALVDPPLGGPTSLLCVSTHENGEGRKSREGQTNEDGPMVLTAKLIRSPRGAKLILSGNGPVRWVHLMRRPTSLQEFVTRCRAGVLLVWDAGLERPDDHGSMDGRFRLCCVPRCRRRGQPARQGDAFRTGKMPSAEVGFDSQMRSSKPCGTCRRRIRPDRVGMCSRQVSPSAWSVRSGSLPFRALPPWFGAASGTIRTSGT